MKFTTYYFRFNSPIHLGNQRPEGYEKSEQLLHSDSITAAVLSAWATMGNEHWINECEGDPNFVISSAFPFAIEENGYKHFFPRPLLNWNRSKYDSSLSKKIKKVQWLDQYYFEKVIRNEDLNNLGINNIHLKGPCLSNSNREKDNFQLFQREMQERVVVSRDFAFQKDARPFVMERLRFSENTGLYILVRNDDERLEQALEFLQTEGFGSDRSVGNGSFELGKGTIEINVPNGCNMAINLGMYCPNDKGTLKDQLNEQAAFQLLKRGGWITSAGNQTYEKNSVYMFAEGSVFLQNKEIDGKGNLDLSPPVMNNKHKVFRSGKSIFIPVKMES